MTDERDRLQDLNIEEALGRTTPPDLTARILNAANQPALEEAPTPISGAHAVPRNVRPAGRRLTAAVPRRNWQGAGIVTAFMLLLTVGLVAFVIWKAPAQETNQPSTAGQPAANQNPSRLPAGASAEEGERWSPPSNAEQKPEPQPQPNQSDPKPDDPIEQPKPEPKPDDTVEQPEPKPDDSVEQPKPEPKPDDTVEQPKQDDKTEAKPAKEAVVVASFSADEGREGSFTYGAHRGVRRSSEDAWKAANDRDAPGLERDERRNVYWVAEGTQLKFNDHDVALTNGAQVAIDGEVSLFTHAQGLRVEILKDDIYVDNLHSSSTLRITMGELEIVINEGAAIIESTKSKLDIFCIDGEVTANGTIILAGHLTSLTARGVGKIRAATKTDWSHSMLNVVPPRHLGVEEFDIAPLGKMISGRLESRTAEQLGVFADGHVAVDTGREAAVGFGFDGEHEALRGETVCVRYRASGAEKMVMQLFCPARNDNFGIDLTPGKDGEWHILKIRLSDLRNRETHTDAPKPGTVLSSFTLAIEGKNDAQLEVDWVELVREARFEE